METKRGQEAPLQSARPCSRSRSAGLLRSLGFVAKDDRKVVTRGKILDAAVRQFGRHGFDNATVKAIAGLASVSPAIVHWYFGSKVVLYAEAVQVAADQFMAAMRRSNGPSETFTSLALHWITHFEDDTGTTGCYVHSRATIGTTPWTKLRGAYTSASSISGAPGFVNGRTHPNSGRKQTLRCSGH